MNFKNYLSSLGILVIVTCWITQVYASNGSEVVKKVVHYYQDLENYSDETVQEIRMVREGLDRTLNARLKLKIERPNKLNLVLTSDQMSLTVNSDGKLLTTFVPGARRYMEKPSPATIADVMDKSMIGMNLKEGTGILILAMFKNNAFQELMENVKDVQVNEQILDGEPVIYVRIIRQKLDIEMWVNPQNYSMIKSCIDLTKTFEDQRKAVPQMLGMQMTITETRTKVIVNRPIDQEVFRFVPPEGVEKTGNLLTAPRNHRVKTGELAPVVKISMLDGKTVALDTLKNRVVLLDFWTTWCLPFQKELPVLQKIHNQYKDSDLTLIALNNRESKSKVQQFITNNGVDFPVGLDLQGKIASSFKIQSFPTLVLIGKTGKIEMIKVGYTAEDEVEISGAIKTLLAGKSLN